MQKNKAKRKRAEEKTFYGLVLTILIVLSCLILFFFADSNYGKKEISIQAEQGTTQTDARMRFENRALKEHGYNIDADGAYILQREALSDARLILTIQNDAVEAFLLCVELPVLPEDSEQGEQSVLEERLYQERKDYFDRNAAWLNEKLPKLTRAIYPADALTDTDMDRVLHHVHEAIQTQKRQELKLDGITVRAYTNASDSERALHISVQREPEQQTQGK